MLNNKKRASANCNSTDTRCKNEHLNFSTSSGNGQMNGSWQKLMESVQKVISKET